MSEKSLIHELEAKLEDVRHNVEETAKLDQTLFSNRMALKSARSLEQLYQAQLAEARRLSVEACELSEGHEELSRPKASAHRKRLTRIEILFGREEDLWLKAALRFLRESDLSTLEEFKGLAQSQIAQLLLEKALHEIGVTKEMVEKSDVSSRPGN